MRFAKYKGPEISGIESHNERTKEKYASNPDIDTSRSHLNFHLIKPERKYRAEAEKQIAEAGCRTHIPSRLFKEAVHLNRMKDQIMAILNDSNPFNKKAKAYKELSAENAELE